MNEKLNSVANILKLHGDRFAGDNAVDAADEWIDNGFSVIQVEDWCEVGVWDVETAATFRDAGLTPSQVKDGADRLVDGMDDEERIRTYTDGCPIYSVCNGDTDAMEIIDAQDRGRPESNEARDDDGNCPVRAREGDCGCKTQKRREK